MFLWEVATLTGSIVLYKNAPDMVEKAVGSFFRSSPQSLLYIVDNSPEPALDTLRRDERIRYIFPRKNLGFGAGHNLVLREVRSEYHVIINPDVYFGPEVLPGLQAFMDQHPDVGHMMPRVLYPDGRMQYLCKLLPTPYTLIMRRFLSFLKNRLIDVNHRYELRFANHEKILDVPFLSGCFMFLRTRVLDQVGLFDERFFLYTEDTDLSRRIHRHYRTLYYPEVTIYHHHEQGSYKDSLLLLHNIFSAIRYFNKWGWAWDTERAVFNQRAIRLAEEYAP